MNNLNYPLRVKKNKPLPFFEMINDGTENKWRNIENNLVFCIDPRKAFAIKSIPRSVFRNPLHHNKIQSTLVVSNFASREKKLETAGVRIKNSAFETGSYYRKSGYG